MKISRIKIIFLYSIVFTILLGALSAVTAQSKSPCPCLEPGNPEYTPGVIWRSDKPEIVLHDIVLMLAPVLWFSSDEPLIAKDDLPIPHPHPCDFDNGNAVVYYQIPRIRLRKFDKIELPVRDVHEVFHSVEAFALRYYFYYREDIGMSPHAHDLEVVEFEINLEATDEGCYQVRVVSVTGFAHGVDWYYNKLDIESDTRFPITLFVEEGKHASCPDRNADGYYTPGYDVNNRINDAWGVRDVLSTGYLMGSKYKASMTKPRKYGFRVLPPSNNLTCTTEYYSSLNEDEGFMGRYELRHGQTVTPCEDIPAEGKRLLGMMKNHKFGREYEPEQYHFEELNKLSEPLSYTGILTGISARYDRDLGISAIFRGIDFGEGYIVPRVTWVNKDASFELLFTSSAAQFFAGYLSAGAQYEYVKDAPDQWDFVAEVGCKFRARLPGNARYFALGYQFAGMRIGVRSEGFNHFDDIRLIIEIGAGLF